MLGDVNKLFIFKSLLTTPSNVFPLHLKQTFPTIIWIFTEYEGGIHMKEMGLNPGYLLKYFLLYLRLNDQSEIQILNGLYRLSIPLETENRVCGCSVQSFVTSLISKMTLDFLNIYWLRQLNENILIFWKVTSFSHFQIWLLWSRVRKLRLKKMSAVLN